MTRRAEEAVIEELRQGREAVEKRAWMEGYAAFSRADEAAPLEADDLERLATCAFMLGRDDEYLGAQERAHHAYLRAGENLRAVRSAFWVGMNLALRGEMGPASGWLARAQRMLEREEDESVEHGYMLMPLAFQHEAAGEFEAGAAVAGEAAAIAERFRDAEAFALAASVQGELLIKAGRVKEGLALLDEAMVGAAGGQLSPIATGIVYCGVILACQEVYEVRRAREWTRALGRWWEQQQDMIAFTGRCLVHRAEILQLDGSWPDALEAARLAGQRFVETKNPAAGLAHYRQGELLRLQGEFAGAEEAYREASRFGWEPHPGLAQLRLAQGRSDAAVAAIRRANAETTAPLKRAGLLPAYVEIMLAVGEIEEARSACRELEQIATSYESAMLGAMVAHARGAVELALGDAGAALVTLRRAAEVWQALEAPYESARTRALIARACRDLGDEDTGTMELRAARGIFEQLRATPDLARLGQPRPSGETRGLSQRELEVLRLVAAGRSNREIASALVISEHTVARHLQNIFAKLGLSSRTAATAFAFENDLV